MWNLFIDRFKTVYKNKQDRSIISEDKEAYLTAKAFMGACSILVAKFSHDGKTMPIVPMITNMAFAIELYLKCLILKDGGHVPTGRAGHDIFGLYCALSDIKKAELLSQLVIDLDSDKTRVESKLSAVHDVFVEWRYVYEDNVRKEIDIEFISRTALAIDKICTKANGDSS